jgi:prephenate dehydrogenase
MKIENKTVAVVGLGLMGGSLIYALKEIYPTLSIVGVTRSRDTIQSAKDKGLIADGFASIKELSLHYSPDVYIIATPVQTIKIMIAEIAKHSLHNPIVTDLGSTKAEIIEYVEENFSSLIRYVGSHPMTGSHNAGFIFSDVNLYKNAICFVTKTSSTDRDSLALISSLWRELKSKVVEIDPLEHDTIVSRISHLPHAVAFSLVDTVTRLGEEGFKYAGGGFRDFTRIAGSDPQMWLDIFQTNKKNIVRDLKEFKSTIEALIARIENNDADALRAYLKHISDYRRTL